MRKLLLLVVFCAPSLFAQHTYYISSGIGADTNTSTQAQSKTTPWAHMPGMVGATSNAAAYTPVAGDSFIFRGGDTWTNSSFPLIWQTTCTIGSPCYAGVDKTWFTGASWVRPIWTAGGSPIVGSGTRNVFWYGLNNATKFLTIDNLEMTGYNWTADNGFGAQAYITLGGTVSGSSNDTVINCYFHGWTHGVAGNADDFYVILGDTNAPHVGNSTIQFNIFDGSDGTGAGDSGQAIKGVLGNTSDNVIHNIANGILPQCTTGDIGTIAYNLIYNIETSFSGAHENAIETLSTAGAQTCTFYIHDNVLHDFVGEGMFLGNSGETDYVWDNVVYNASAPPPMHMVQQPGEVPVAMTYWNNTVVPPSGVQCFFQAFSATIGSVTIQNNHCITTSTLTNTITASTLTVNNNTLMTPTTAASQGYTTSETFVYSPTLVSNSTVGAGTNLTSSATGNLAGLVNDTSYACSAQTVSGVLSVVCPARATATRPSVAAWDVGAYEFGTPTASTPTFSPVAGSYSSTQSVTITASTGGVICYNTTGSPQTNNTTGCQAGSTKYTTPVSVPSSETLFAVAGGTGFVDSAVGSAAYIITTGAANGKIGGGVTIGGGVVIH